MSVTITIENNAEVSQPHIEETECFCSGVEDNCHLCDNTGIMKLKVYPYELNLSEDNFRSLWKALNLKISFDGRIDPRTLSNQLSISPKKVVKSSKVEGNVIDFGITVNQAERYLNLLKEMTSIAMRREDNIIWH